MKALKTQGSISRPGSLVILVLSSTDSKNSIFPNFELTLQSIVAQQNQIKVAFRREYSMNISHFANLVLMITEQEKIKKRHLNPGPDH